MLEVKTDGREPTDDDLLQWSRDFRLWREQMRRLYLEQLKLRRTINRIRRRAHTTDDLDFVLARLVHWKPRLAIKEAISARAQNHNRSYDQEKQDLLRSGLLFALDADREPQQIRLGGRGWIRARTERGIEIADIVPARDLWWRRRPFRDPADTAPARATWRAHRIPQPEYKAWLNKETINYAEADIALEVRPERPARPRADADACPICERTVDTTTWVCARCGVAIPRSTRAWNSRSRSQKVSDLETQAEMLGTYVVDPLTARASRRAERREQAAHYYDWLPAARQLADAGRLSPQEQQIVQLAGSLSRHEIALTLKTTEKTIRAAFARIRQKLAHTNR